MPDQPPLWQDVRWIVATLFALWGAGLSTFQQIVKRREQRPEISVSVRKTIAVGAGPRTDHFSIDVRNTGRVDVFFKSARCSFEVEGAEPRLMLNLFTCDTSFPAVLRPGNSFSILAPRDATFVQSVRSVLPNGRIRLRADVWDAIDRRFVSNWVDVEEPQSTTTP
jgi:hypothetical protein